MERYDIAIIGTGSAGLEAAKVIYIPMYEEVGTLNKKIRIMKDVIPVSIEKQENKLVLHTDKQSIVTDGIFILRDNVAALSAVNYLSEKSGEMQW